MLTKRNGNAAQKPKSFEFVALSRPDREVDAQTLSKIRRHAMKDIGAARRKSKKSRSQVFLSVQNSADAFVPQLSPTLDSWNVVPFVKLPIELDEIGRGLLANVFRNEGDSLQAAHRTDWFTVGIADPASFNLILANSELHLERLRSPKVATRETRLSMYYHQRAIAAFRIELSKVPLVVSDEMMGCVAGLVAYAGIAGLMDQWQMQRNGLMHLLRLRPGGIDSMNRNEHLRAALSWIELHGAYMDDVVPILPLPPKWLQAYESGRYDLQQESQRMKRPDDRNPHHERFPHGIPWPNIFRKVSQISHAANNGNCGEVFQWPVEVPLCTNVATYNLLRLRPLSDPLISDSNTANMIEACRLGMLLYLMPIWRRNGVTALRPEVYVARLQQHLTMREIKWGNLWDLRLWVLFCGTMETETVQHRQFFLASIVSAMTEHDVLTPGHLMETIENVAWIRGTFDRQSQAVLSEVEGLLIPNASTVTKLQIL